MKKDKPYLTSVTLYIVGSDEERTEEEIIEHIRKRHEAEQLRQEAQ